MKKIICLVLITFVLLTAFAGCGNTGSKNTLYNPDIKIGDTGGLKLPLSKESTEITWFVNSDLNNLNESYVLNKLREITGVNVQLIVTPPSTVAEKAKVLIASKNLPDIFGTGLTESEAYDLCMQGAFAPVEDYIDKLPNFKSTFVDNEKNNWIFKSYRAPDGKLYGFYGYDWNREVNTGATMYRKDIFDKHGIPMWNSTEGFYETLKKLKSLYPNSTPYALKTKDGIFSNLAPSWGFVTHMPYYDEEAKIWKYGDTDPKFKDMLDFLKKLYDEKLIDPEFLTATQADWTSKMTQRDKAFITTDWIGRMDMFKQQTADTIPEYDLRYANPVGPKQTMKTLSQLCWARYVSRSDRTETAFKLLDFILSPAGAELITMGIEGETYEIGSDGMANYLEYEEGAIPSINELSEKYGMFIEGMYLRFDRRSSYFKYTEREKEAQDFAKDPKNMEPEDPILPFTKEDREKLTEYQGNLEKAAKEFAVKYILTNESGETAWNNWVKKAEQLGCEKVVEIYNEAQKRYDAQ